MAYSPLTMKDSRAASDDAAHPLFEPQPEPTVQNPLDMQRTEYRSSSAPPGGHKSGYSVGAPTRGSSAASQASVLRRRYHRFMSFESNDGSVAELQMNCGRRRKIRNETAGPDLNLPLLDICKAIRQVCDLKPSKKLKAEMLDKAVHDGELRVDRLEELGFTAEDLCRVIYDEHINQYEPNLIRHLHIEEHGGLGRIESVWIPNDEKYLWFVYLLLSVAFNLTFLMVINWAIFETYLAHLSNGFLQDLHHIKGLKELMNATSKLELSSGDNSTSEVVEHSMQLAIVFREIHSASLVRILLNIATLIASWEVLWIFFKIVYSLHLWVVFLADSSEFRAYRAANVFFKDVLPQFSTFSAIKFMARVHPSLLYNRYMYNIKESSWRGTYAGRVATIVFFAVENLICVAVGVMAFGIKLLAVGLRLINPADSWGFRICSVISLMIQCMGCVLMEKGLQDRVYLFVFGGQDSEYQDDEHAYKTVYECRITKQIWFHYWQCGQDRWERFKAIVILATFDHYDLQKLLLQDTDVNLRFREHSHQQQGDFAMERGLSAIGEGRSELSSPDARDSRFLSAELESSAPLKEDTDPSNSPQSSCSLRSFGMRAVARSIRADTHPRKGQNYDWGDSLILADAQPV